MEFALSTIFFLLFLSPGIFFRRFYYTEEFSKQFIKESPYNLLLSTFLPTVMIQGAALLLYDGISVEEIHVTIEGNFDGLFIKRFAIYSLIINFLAMLSGFFSKKTVRYLRLDRKFKLFRFRNTWHYLFSGEIFSFPKADVNLYTHKVNDIELKYVDCMVKTGEGDMIYEGVLVDYELSKEHGLEHIVLKDVKRKLFKDELSKANNKGFQNLTGHTFIIPYAQMININITYYSVRRHKETGQLYSVQIT